MAFELEALPYASNALEPHIDKETMEIHHDRHHQAYVDNLNKAIAGTDAENLSLEEINKNISKYPAAVRNNGGGHFNHKLFWTVLSANGGGEPTGELADAINQAFGSFSELKTQLQNAGATRFGSGWAWLVVKADGQLAVTSTPNQDNPLMDVAEVQGTPILGIDVWEHAYYLKYQNKRPAYLDAIFNVIDWNAVAKRYQEAK
ncbi:superoxide dismutase [Sphingobacterium corticibacterium]|uniref:Superoxide dismutase n=1 Tax=Sphingobacterium corticibacterium TaxID=2484746 RepID=A0A4Q6XGD1_9SPHI|nr:superoxide dismutase [Sphingobacterium corticibacterium]RZF58543.1 superoxide dismutase [Sphingobacterium corticibacterium]